MTHTESVNSDQEIPSQNLQGKVALITGASKGIGAAMAWALAASGAKVVVNSRKQEAVDAVAAAMVNQGYEAKAIAAKMGEPGAGTALIEGVLAAYGRLDILINNAATNPVYGPIVDTSMEAFDKIFSVNVRSPFELCKLAHPHMKAVGGGSIIHIASVAGVSPWEAIGIYSASKTALIGLTKVMAGEWGRDGIRVNVVCPGLIQTKFSRALWENEKAMRRFEKNLALPRIGQPQDLMGLAIFLASDLSSYCTGGVFTVDGGLTI